MPHRASHLFVRQHTADINSIRGTARNAAPIDPAIRTIQLGHSIIESVLFDRDLILAGHCG
jgi:hypothetical protein